MIELLLYGKRTVRRKFEPLDICPFFRIFCKCDSPALFGTFTLFYMSTLPTADFIKQIRELILRRCMKTFPIIKVVKNVPLNLMIKVVKCVTQSKH